LSWSLVSQLMEKSDPAIPTDMIIQLEEQEEEDEEGFHLVRKPTEVGVHKIVLSLVSPLFRQHIYGSHPSSTLTMPGVKLPALQTIISHIYGQEVDWSRLTKDEMEQVGQIASQYQIAGLVQLEAGDTRDQEEEGVLVQINVLNTEDEDDENINLEIQSSDSEYEEENKFIEQFMAGETDDEEMAELEDEKETKESQYDEEDEHLEDEYLRALEMFEEMNTQESISSPEIERILEEENNSVTNIMKNQDEEYNEAVSKEAECENCGCVACRDGHVIGSTLELRGKLGCQVAVANCVTSYWGNGYRAQRGQVTSLDSLSTVSVRWVDGSESQYNVYHTEKPETDSVLCFHCREEPSQNNDWRNKEHRYY